MYGKFAAFVFVYLSESPRQRRRTPVAHTAQHSAATAQRGGAVGGKRQAVLEKLTNKFEGDGRQQIIKINPCNN